MTEVKSAKYIRDELSKAMARREEIVSMNAEAQAELAELKAEVVGKHIDRGRYLAVCELQGRLSSAIARRVRELSTLKTRIRVLSNSLEDAKEELRATTQGCEWTEDRGGVWLTDCGEDFVLDEDTPSGNGMKFCCFCGGQLRDTWSASRKTKQSAQEGLQ